MHETQVFPASPNEPQLGFWDVKRITKQDANQLKIGDVILVVSDYKFEKYGYHYSLIVGGLVEKERGLRPELDTFTTIKNVDLLDSFMKADGAVVLLLSEEAKQRFYTAYNVSIVDGKVVYNNTLSHVMEVFESYRMAPTSIDQYQQVGKGILEEKISSFISSGEKIEFAMLGYPMKSPNERDKVIGRLPDMGEQLSVENFKNFSDAISTVYKPGININLISDGYVFSDVMKISDITVAGYEEVMQDMIRIAPIKWYSARDFYSKKLTNNEVRQKVMSQFGISPLQLEQRILTDPDVNFLYRGMIRFLEVDLAAYAYNSNSSLHKDAKRVAREMMFRNEAYSQLIRDEFKDSIRLSMHPSVNNGSKYSFQLILSPNAWTSPWHCAIAIDSTVEGNGKYRTMHRKDAIAEGYQLQFKDGRPYFFTK